MLGNTSPETFASEHIRVSGRVQGVGMRPTVFGLAQTLGLWGDVRNDAHGVLIRVSGPRKVITEFVQQLREQAPPLARIDDIHRQETHDTFEPGFHILTSVAGAAHTQVSPDAAICAACRAEVRDASNRRHDYAFANCTHCGPRLSIIDAIPYDRANTSMRSFTLCPQCRDEYEDPADRRFHAQPNACPVCGPHLTLERSDGTAPITDTPVTDTEASQTAVDRCAAMLRNGSIVAIKGLGGFHLACLARDEAAVARLRERKQRYDKPFALMLPSLDLAQELFELNEKDRALLDSPQAPILLLSPRANTQLAPSIAPALRVYGVMLPYTPLHQLLMDGVGEAIVLTSGNRSSEPQCIDNATAREKLAGIADALLLHDREIINRVDDSVVRRIVGTPRLLRRARGYAPSPIRLPQGFEQSRPLLAFGSELKNTFCLLRDGEAILSQHLGDLENASAYRAYQDTLSLYLNLFEHQPESYVTDRHPEYLSTKLGRDWAQTNNLPVTEVQHHHAHVAACMADNALPLNTPPLLGIALDGLGLGDNGELWGGEFLLSDYFGYQRIGSFAPLPLPGAAQAIREPWRIAYAALHQHFDWPLLAKQYAGTPFMQAMMDKPLAILERMLDTGLNSPESSACGRLFDAVSALAGVRHSINYEGQAAIELEACIDAATLTRGEAYPFKVVAPEGGEGLVLITTKSLWQAILDDLAANTDAGVIAARFHNGLAEVILEMLRILKTNTPAIGKRIALSGGVFQNATLLEALITKMQSAGFEVFSHSQVPSNDGGLSLGQATVAAARQIRNAHKD